MATKKSNPKNTLKLTELEFTLHNDDNDGYCLYCNEFTYGGVEPDARNYLCEGCGEKKVFGIEELMIRGMVEVVDDEEEGEKKSILKDYLNGENNE